jgi:hypothetical protein
MPEGLEEGNKFNPEPLPDEGSAEFIRTIRPGDDTQPSTPVNTEGPTVPIEPAGSTTRAVATENEFVQVISEIGIPRLQKRGQSWQRKLLHSTIKDRWARILYGLF